MNKDQEIDVRKIIASDAPYVGNVMRIPPNIQQKARHLCWKYNMTDPSDSDALATILRELLGSWDEHVVIMPHVHFDYGINTHFACGHFTFVNFDCVFLDTSPIYRRECVYRSKVCIGLCWTSPSFRATTYRVSLAEQANPYWQQCVARG